MNTKPRIPPGPKGRLLLGNLREILHEPFDFLIRCRRDHGDVVRVRVGPLVVYLVNHPDAIEQVLRRDHRNFIKDRGTRMLSALLGQGFLTSEGEVWRRQRRLAQPAFQLDQIQKYGAVIAACAERMLLDWQPGQTRDRVRTKSSVVVAEFVNRWIPGSATRRFLRGSSGDRR